MEEYILIGVVYLITIIKLLGNYFRWKDDLKRNTKAGELYHIFELIIIPASMLVGIVIKMSFLEFGYYFFSFMLIYGFIMSVGFNKLTGKGSNALGRTETTDKWLANIFMIKFVGDVNYVDLTAKQKQWNNFKRSLIVGLRFILFVVGHILILNLFN